MQIWNSVKLVSPHIVWEMIHFMVDRSFYTLQSVFPLYVLEYSAWETQKEWKKDALFFFFLPWLAGLCTKLTESQFKVHLQAFSELSTTSHGLHQQMTPVKNRPLGWDCFVLHTIPKVKNENCRPSFRTLTTFNRSDNLFSKFKPRLMSALMSRHMRLILSIQSATFITTG